jgi:hypothetical protein
MSESAKKERLRKATCTQCGVAFQDIPDDPNFSPSYDDHKFCSNACRDAFVEEHGVCTSCGKPLKGKNIFRQRIGRNKGDFCSAKCYEDYRQKNIIINTCVCCGKEFVANRSTMRYCSPECRTKETEWRKNISKVDYDRYMMILQNVINEGKAGGMSSEKEARMRKLGFSQQDLLRFGFFG